MIKLILKTSLVFCLASLSSLGRLSFRPFLKPLPCKVSVLCSLRNYSFTSELANKTLSSNKNLSPKLPGKILNNLSPIKIYTSLNHPTKKIKMLNDLTGEGGIVLFLAKNTSFYAIEGSCNLTGYLQDFFNKEILELLADIKIPKAIQKKSKIQLKTHYQELLRQGWKDYDLYLLETWKTSEDVDIEHRLAYYHTKYKPKLNIIRYVALADGKIEAVYQWNKFRTEEEMLAKSQKKATTKPLLTYRLDSASPLSKWQGKAYYENKKKTGIYRWINRNTKESYIGSSLNLGQILYALDSNSIVDNQQALYSAMQEYGLTSFNLQILAYCSKEELNEKEQYYLNLYQPEYNTVALQSKDREYNINKENKEDRLIINNWGKQSFLLLCNSLSKLPTSIMEYNAFAKQLVLFQPPNQQITNIYPSPSLSSPLLKDTEVIHKGLHSLIPWEIKPVHLLIREITTPIVKVKTKKWTLSETTRLKQSLAQQKRTKHPKPGLSVQVQDLVKSQTIIYSSYREAARALNIDKQIISDYFNRNQIKPYKKRYIFTKA